MGKSDGCLGSQTKCSSCSCGYWGKLDAPDLKNQIYENLPEKVGYPGVDDDGNGKIDDIRGWDFIGDGNSPEDNNPEDYNGHSTLLPDSLPQNTIVLEWWGFVKLRRFLPIRVGTAMGTVYRYIEASEYAVSRGVKILNWSFGSLRESSLAEKRAISKFEQDGVLVIIAAGNEANDNDGFTSAYPASYENENIISVASNDEDGALSSFSNWGKSSVDLAAPGSEILSAKVETRTIKSYF